MKLACEILTYASAIGTSLWTILVFVLGVLAGTFGMAYSERKWLLAGNPLWHKGKAYYLTKEGRETPAGLEL